MIEVVEKFTVFSEEILRQLREEGQDILSVRPALADKNEWNVSSLGTSRRKGSVRPWIIENKDGTRQNVFAKKVKGYEATNEITVSRLLGNRTYEVLSPRNLDKIDINTPTSLITQTISGYVPLEHRATYRNGRFAINSELLKGVANALFECRSKGIILYDAKLRNFGVVTGENLLSSDDDGIRMVDFESTAVTNGEVTPKIKFLLSLRDFFGEVDFENSFKTSDEERNFKEFLKELYNRDLLDSDIDFERDLMPAVFIGEPE